MGGCRILEIILSSASIWLNWSWAELGKNQSCSNEWLDLKDTSAQHEERDYSSPVGLKGVSLVGTKHRIWQQIGNYFSYGNKNVRINLAKTFKVITVIRMKIKTLFNYCIKNYQI